jgi:hypothetical protein
MIKKALTAAFPLMVQDDRIAVQLAGVLWIILWNATDSTDILATKRPGLPVEAQIGDDRRLSACGQA